MVSDAPPDADERWPAIAVPPLRQFFNAAEDAHFWIFGEEYAVVFEDLFRLKFSACHKRTFLWSCASDIELIAFLHPRIGVMKAFAYRNGATILRNVDPEPKYLDTLFGPHPKHDARLLHQVPDWSFDAVEKLFPSSHFRQGML